MNQRCDAELSLIRLCHVVMRVLFVFFVLSAHWALLVWRNVKFRYLFRPLRYFLPAPASPPPAGRPAPGAAHIPVLRRPAVAGSAARRRRSVAGAPSAEPRVTGAWGAARADHSLGKRTRVSVRQQGSRYGTVCRPSSALQLAPLGGFGLPSSSSPLPDLTYLDLTHLDLTYLDLTLKGILSIVF